MIENEIKNIVYKVLSSKHEIDYIGEDDPLTGAKIKAEAEEIVYIVLELMNRFNIVFDREDFCDYKFNTITGIIQAVKRHCI